MSSYVPEIMRSYITSLVASTASHHRLTWIHPFLDGNGRVTRLFSKAYLMKIGLKGHGLWAVSRGLARKREEYFAALTWGDAKRQGDLDGRGNLSDLGLRHFCEFYLRTMLDQIEFMASVLEFAKLERRIKAYVERAEITSGLPAEAAPVICETFLRGEISRGDATRLSGKSERFGSQLIKTLLTRGLIKSDTPKGLLRFACPVQVVGFYFPNLYPSQVEANLEAFKPLEQM